MSRAKESDMNTNPLIGPELKVKRAVQHIRDLNTEIIKFAKRKPIRSRREDDPKTGDDVYKIKIVHDIPEIWGCYIGDVIHNLRSALDLLAHAIVLEFPLAEARAEVSFRELELNPDLPPEIFVLGLPGSTTLRERG